MAIVSDIPATRPWLTVVDLIDSGEELSLVANVLADALERGLVEDEGALREKIDAGGGCSYSFVNWAMLFSRLNRDMLTPGLSADGLQSVRSASTRRRRAPCPA